jgi:hypothetical protein
MLKLRKAGKVGMAMLAMWRWGGKVSVSLNVVWLGSFKVSIMIPLPGQPHASMPATVCH